MIRDYQNGKIDYIITKSVSRFARNTVECLEYVRSLKEQGIGIFFEEQNPLPEQAPVLPGRRAEHPRPRFQCHAGGEHLSAAQGHGGSGGRNRPCDAGNGVL